MSIIFGADIVPTEKNIEQFKSGDTEYLVGKELLDELADADFRVFNLETPLINHLSPINKVGPTLGADAGAVYGLKKLGVDLVTLANNHILDHGEQGLLCTQRVLSENGIDYFGVGETNQKASKPYIYTDVNGKRIGIYACVEHEFSITEDGILGANPFDALESFDHVAALKKQCDFCAVLYHGGKECYRYPSPDLQRVCRKFVDCGADMVICQHTHCIGCEEKYKNSVIVYGQGNFLFDKVNNEYWATGLLIRLENDFSLSYIPVKKDGNKVRKAEKSEAEHILSDFNKRSESIKKSEFIQKKYDEFSNDMLYKYFLAFSAMQSNIFNRILNKITNHRYGKWVMKKRYNSQRSYELQNYMECEAHRELFLNGVKNIRK